ncbi:unnamed protein product [Trichogramma brassicae]|uniref:Ig-like domain-containing protein n=1 Tax=Trichogramma brassicae TaxID=86971 RepID=A0A6H5IT10_9HYME|nr:unnamed protein product [Trichogramma brassicae]
MKSLVSVDQTIKSAWLTNACDINVNVKIPREAEINKSVNLDCTWWLSSNNSSLYSVKWYKDEYEFYSYMPENDPDSRIKTHPVNGVNVDVRFQNNELKKAKAPRVIIKLTEHSQLKKSNTKPSTPNSSSSLSEEPIKSTPKSSLPAEDNIVIH